MSESDESFGLGLDEPPQPAKAAAAQPYRVLARKYRPQSFGELIGQDAMVQTLGNAIRRDRLAHAFLLTGVRGVETCRNLRGCYVRFVSFRCTAGRPR